jgi:hypothetical protein
VTISNPAAPTGTSPQTFCAITNPTVASLTTITGTGIQWYAAATGGSPLAPSTALVSGNSYYATQTVSGCESASRLAVAVTISSPAAPTLSSPSNLAIDQSTTPTLSWNTVSGASSYHLQVSTSSTFGTTIFDQSGITGTSQGITGLNVSTTYYWRVSTLNTGCESVWSVVWSFTTVPPAPSAPVLSLPANKAVINVDSVAFVWFKALPAVNTYVFEIATDSLISTMVSIDTVTDTTATHKGLASGTTYWWRVKAHNSGGWGNYSDTFKFTVTSTAVILPKSYSLNLFGMSNARSIIKYALPKPSHVSIRLYSIQGKRIASLVDSYQAAGYYQIPVNLAVLSKGFYIISFTAGNHVIRKKLINF